MRKRIHLNHAISWRNVLNNLLFPNLLTHIFNCVLSVLSLKFTIKISLTKSHYSAALKWKTFVHFHINKFGILSHFHTDWRKEDVAEIPEMVWMKKNPLIVIKSCEAIYQTTATCRWPFFCLFHIQRFYKCIIVFDEI